MKQFRYIGEAVLLYTLFFIFRLMPAQTASAVGGWIGRTVGPRLSASRKAYRNLDAAIPGLNTERQKQIITGMWDNLGRIIAEYSHLEKLARDCTTIKNPDNRPDAEQGALIFSGHIGNWEINGPASLFYSDKKVDLTYRALNNPYNDRLLSHARTLKGRINAYSKSREGGKKTMVALKGGAFVGMLIDQKYNEGLSVPFFGRPAMTNPVFVQLCQKFKCPLVPCRVIRHDGAHFAVELEKPIPVFDMQGEPRPIEDVILEAHQHLERWIREYPEQWLWLHRRWDSGTFKDDD